MLAAIWRLDLVSVMFKGVVVSVLASVLFASLYYLSPFLAPLDGEQIFGWRVLVTLPFTTALLFALKEVAAVRDLLARALAQPGLECCWC
jgi:chloramphenicol-sensitive protein RarD